MGERLKAGPVAYATAQYGEYNTTDQASKLEHLHEVGQAYIEQGHAPFYDSQFLEHHIAKLREEQRGNNFSFSWMPENPHGNFLKQNTHREGYVLPEPATVERIEKLIHDEPDIQNIVFAVYSNGYSVFRNIAKYLHKEHPGIEVVAGAVGSLFPETQRLAHHVLNGNQIDDMRRLLGEPLTDPLHITTTPSHTSTTYNSVIKKSTIGVMISSYGCPYQCDFCPTTAQYQGVYTTPHTADEIVDAIYHARSTIAPDTSVMSLSIADPQGLGDIPVWREVFRRCRNMGFLVELATTTSSKILKQYSKDELAGGDLCLSCVNIGVESMISPYSKNQGVDLRKEIEMYQSAGIRVAVTFIIGHDWHNTENIWDEVNEIQRLGASGYIVSNMMMERGTTIFNKMKSEGRLLEVPPEFEATYGYQSFKHPHLESGFNTMVPILSRIEAKLNQGTDIFTGDILSYFQRINPKITEIQNRLRKQMTEIEKTVKADDSFQTDVKNIEIRRQQAQLYYDTIFLNIDYFHPYITWNV